MKSVKLAIATTALTAAAAVLAPPAHAMMALGNYDVLTNRYTQASWVWFISACQPATPDCLQNQRDTATEVLRLLRRLRAPCRRPIHLER